MSTNYYIQRPDGEDGLHLGQWANDKFTMRAHSDLGIMTVEDWIPILLGKKIVSEYGTPHSWIDWLDMVRESKNGLSYWERYYVGNPIVNLDRAWYDERWDLVVIDHEFF